MMTAIDDLVLVRSIRAKRMRLSFDPQSGEVRLILPKRAALEPALQWARKHQGWIDAQRSKSPDPQPILPGMRICLAGEELVLDWAERHSRTPARVDMSLRIGGPIETLPARLMRWLKKEALQRLANETRLLAEQHGITIGRVGVGDPKRRWGSCSGNGDIRYSWRLLLAPEAVMKATIAHEVAHRLHMDHSPAFHAAVIKLFGRNPKAERAWLRKNGASLHSFGRAS